MEEGRPSTVGVAGCPLSARPEAPFSGTRSPGFRFPGLSESRLSPREAQSLVGCGRGWPGPRPSGRLCACSAVRAAERAAATWRPPRDGSAGAGGGGGMRGARWVSAGSDPDPGRGHLSCSQSGVRASASAAASGLPVCRASGGGVPARALSTGGLGTGWRGVQRPQAEAGRSWDPGWGARLQGQHLTVVPRPGLALQGAGCIVCVCVGVCLMGCLQVSCLCVGLSGHRPVLVALCARAGSRPVCSRPRQREAGAAATGFFQDV